MESAGERYFRTSCWRTSRNRKSEISDTKTAISDIPYKAFSMWYCVHHWFCEPFISNLFEMLKSQKKKKKGQLHTSKLTWQRKRRIFIGGTFGKNYNEGKDIKVTKELQEFQIHKQLTEEKKNVSNTGKWGGGVLLRILGGGVPPGSPNPDPITDQNMSFSTLVFRPGL